MSYLQRLATAITLGSVIVSSAYAASNPRISAHPEVRVLEKVDLAKTVTIPNSHPAIADGLADQGRLAKGTQLKNMILVLNSSDAQISALHSLIDAQQDKTSPNYHQWMTPEAFAASFGVATNDVAKVTAWLQDAGLSVDQIAKGGRVIVFSGTSGQVESAFQAEFHHVSINGESHIVNKVDISVPQALAPVIGGIATLSDIFPKTSAVNPHRMVLGTDGQMHPVLPGTSTPDYTSTSSGSHYVAPADVATIYNANPLLASGINGRGVTIGVIGQSSINLSNVETFRSLFSLPPNDPAIVNVGPTPAIIADDIESDLDVEWAGALATAAQVNFYTSEASLIDSGVNTSALAAVDANIADIISLSYGGCELSNGAAGTAYWNTLWEQAAAQGQTVFVSSGDSSATGCASSSAALATGTTAGSYGVNALGSSAYNVAVGGSEFNEGTALGSTTYWGPGGVSPYGSALSYIPETVWSEGAFDIVQAASGVAGGGGGVSIFTGRPSWQVGPGITSTDPAGPTFTATGAIPATSLHRLVPDVALIAAGGHDGTIFCSEGVCSITATGGVGGFGVVGGTSVATPVMAGVQALINQKNGGRQGNANYYYYKLAAAQTTASCASTLPPAATCNFNDIVSGDNYSPKTSSGFYSFATQTNQGVSGKDYIGFPALAGYDEATGLGTPNITNLANNWSTVSFNATTTKLTLTPTTSTHGTTVTAVISVAPTAGSGVPTGDVSIIAIGQPTGPGDGTFYTLSGGTVTALLQSLPGGTYNVEAHYAGDSVYGASYSAPISVTIAKEPSAMLLQPYNITTAGAVNATSSFAYGTSIYFDTEIVGQSATGYTAHAGAPNTGAPTGSVTYGVVSGSTTLPSATEPLDPYGTTYLEVAQSFPNFLIAANYPVIVPGSYSVTASYPGDNSFGAVSNSANVTVVKATVLPTLRTGTATITSGATAVFSVTLAASGAGVLPTGTVTLTDTTTSAVLGTLTLANGAGGLSSTAIVTAGANSVTATYSGDSNYNTSTSTPVTVTVGGTGSTVTLTASPATAPVLSTISLVATVPAGATGTVTFYDGAVSLGTGTVNTTTHLAALNTTILTAGTHSITAAYGGNGTISSSVSAIATVVMTQNTPRLALTSQQANIGQATVSMNAVLTLVPNVTGTANPFPSVPVQFLDGTTVLGSSPVVRTLNYGYYTAAYTTPKLAPGYHTLTANFPGDLNYATATSGVQNVAIGITTLNLTTSATNVGTGTPFTLTATVVPALANTQAITGTVSFYDGAPGGTLIGTSNVTGGVATLTTTKVTTVGTHGISAVYSGDTNYYTSTNSGVVSIVFVTPGFTIAVNPTSLTVAQGTSGTVAVTATTYGNYNGTAPLTCSGLPANSYCTFTFGAGVPPQFFTLPGTDANFAGTLSITALKPHVVKGAGFNGMLWLPMVALVGFLGLRRKQLSVRGRQMMVMAILLCGTLATTACSSLGMATPAGTYTVTVTANGVPNTSVSPGSPAIQPTTTLALTVTQ